ncbi:MFS transporter [Streptomyces sp. NPDC058252]|uniref:MFS transporter n=1 Tax=Streptomyces sp. NPDC058252 TaxID=3346405 RepID=UPI0036EFE5CF
MPTALPAPALRKSPADTPGDGWSALRIPDFRLFTAAQTLSNASSWVQRTAQDWLVLSATHSATAVGIAVALQCLPALTLGLCGGVVADRYPRRLLLTLCAVLNMLLALALATLVACHEARLSWVYVIAALLGTVSAIETPARQAFLPDFVDRDRLRSAVSITSCGRQLGRLTGPATAGVLIGFAGVSFTFALCASASLACLCLLLRMRAPQGQHRCPQHGRPEHRWEALRHVAARPELLWILALVALMGILGSNFAVLLPTYAALGWGAGAPSFGVLSTVLAAGSLCGALLAGRLHGGRLTILAASAGVLGALETGAAACPGVGAFAVLLAPIGMCALVFSTTANAAVQLSGKRGIQGRIGGLYVVAMMGGGAVGGPLTGALVHTVGPRAAFADAGLSCMLLGVLAIALAFHFRRSRAAPAASAASGTPQGSKPLAPVLSAGSRRQPDLRPPGAWIPAVPGQAHIGSGMSR